MKTIEQFQIRKIYAIGSALGIKGSGMDEDELHMLVGGITGKASIKSLTYKEACVVIARLEELQGNLFMNWLWLFLLYVTFCCLLYLIILIINKTGKNVSIILGVIFGGIVLLIVALFRYVFTGETIHNILEFLMKAMGFMADGTINYIFPTITLFILLAILGSGAYAIIRRTELK